VVWPGNWLVSSIWFLLSIRLLELWGELRLPACVGWSELLFSPGSSCAPQQGGVFQFWMLLSVSEIGSRIPCFEMLAYYTTPALSLCAFPDLWWVLISPLRGWLVTLLLLSAFTALPALVHWEFGTKSLATCPTPILWGRFSVPPPPPLLVLDYGSLFMLSVLLRGLLLCLGYALDYFLRVCVGELCVVCDAHPFILPFHASSFVADWWGEMAVFFFFFTGVWCKEAFHRPGV
jgi:hypothetical protein